MKSLHSLLFCGVLLLHASCSGIKTSDEKSLDDCPLVATWKQAGTDSGIGRRVDKRYHADTAQPVGRRPGDYQA